MMAGLPVLTSPLIAVKEILHTYDVGHVLTSLEPADVAAKIHAMLDDTRNLDYMRENALRASQQEFCWEKEMHSLLRLYYRIYQKQNKEGVNKQ